jgi:hypothetical protein
MENTFLQLSSILTGFEPLDAKLGRLYYHEVKKAAGAQLTLLLETYETKVAGQPGNPEDLIRACIWNVQDLRTLSQAIINLWYTAILNFGAVSWIAPPEAYFDSLLWKAIEAHPPAISGGYFGYWRYPPEN